MVILVLSESGSGSGRVLPKLVPALSFILKTQTRPYYLSGWIGLGTRGLGNNCHPYSPRGIIHTANATNQQIY